MKRLYAEVGIVQDSKGFAIALDDKPIKTPGRRRIPLPTRALAEAIADEWRGQGASLRPDTMKLMQLAATVIDSVAADRDAVEAAVMRFAETDLVCYRADQPPDLVRRQRAAWDPLLDWLAERAGVILIATTGFLPVKQSPTAITALAQIVRTMDDWRFGAFQAAASASGSFVIALALVDGRINADEAFWAAELDESFGIERWGEDPAAAGRRAGIASDLAAARWFCDLLRG